MPFFYNENDPFAASWLWNLTAAGHLHFGDVDTRSIADVQPIDLDLYSQHHFFAGIGGWPYALKLAGWPDDRPVWTGSCPCQPFSAAGKRKGVGDARHLWPEFYRLIAECRPPVIFGEQVASKDGRAWLAGIRADLEALGYAVGAADLGAAGVGAPHIRQRLWWVANAIGAGYDGSGLCLPARQGASYRDQPPFTGSGSSSSRKSSSDEAADSGLGDANKSGSQGRGGRGHGADERAPWAAGVAIPCADGKTRRIEPGSFPLAHGVSNRVGRLRGYGNAIVPQVAAAFIRSYMEARGIA